MIDENGSPVWAASYPMHAGGALHGVHSSLMRWALAIGVVGIAVAQLSGCRDALGIGDQPLVEDAGGADAADVETRAPTFCDKLSPAPQHCADDGL